MSTPSFTVRPDQRKLSKIVPGHVFRQKKFKFEPKGFHTQSFVLNNKPYAAELQEESLDNFTASPRDPLIYVVCSAPCDSMAKYFAAYLTEIHVNAGGHFPVWHAVHNGFSNPLMDDQDITPTMLVLTNLSPVATNMKIDKVRDLVSKYTDIPIIITAAGMNPIELAATKLFLPVHAMFWMVSNVVNTTVEVL